MYNGIEQFVKEGRLKKKKFIAVVSFFFSHIFLNNTFLIQSERKLVD